MGPPLPPLPPKARRLEQSLEEERSADGKLDELAESGINLQAA